MAEEVFDVGDRAQVTATVTNTDGDNDSPDAVTWSVKDPAGTVTTPSDSVVAAGVHRITVDCTLPGRYRVRFVGSANPKCAGEDSLFVRRSHFP